MDFNLAAIFFLLVCTSGATLADVSVSVPCGGEINKEGDVILKDFKDNFKDHPLPDYAGFGSRFTNGHLVDIGRINRIGSVYVVCKDNNATINLKFMVNNIQIVYQWEMGFGFNGSRKVTGPAYLYISSVGMSMQLSKNRDEENSQIQVDRVTATSIRGTRIVFYGMGMTSTAMSRAVTLAFQKEAKQIIEVEARKVLETNPPSIRIT